MRVSIVTSPGFNEIDSFVTLNALGRMPGWRVELVGHEARPVSMHGVPVEVAGGLDALPASDVVVFGSGTRTRQLVDDPSWLEAIEVDPERQVVAGQCSGALVLARLGLLDDAHAWSTDARTRPHLVAAGVDVVDEPLVVHGNVVTAAGCLSAVSLSAHLLVRFAGEDECVRVLERIAPVGEVDDFVKRAMAAG